MLPALINSMVVEINRGDKASAIAFFEALSSFWRALHWCVTTDDTLRAEAVRTVQSFIEDRAARHKRAVPDVGCLLALATALIGEYDRAKFVDAYLDESFVRCVMWWQGECRAEAAAVFRATAVSRGIFLFQLTVLREVIGDAPASTAEAMDASNGRVPERLDALQAAWKELTGSAEPASWDAYAAATGCSPETRQRMGATTDAWIAECVKRAAEAGYSRGKGKGKGGGKGGGGGGKGGGGGGKGGGGKGGGKNAKKKGKGGKKKK